MNHTILKLSLIALLLGCTLAQAAPPYEANWESIDSRPSPPWFEDAKFGIFIHWGVYSVPAWGSIGKYSEWYWRDMRNRKSETWEFHERVYGEDFPYEDFAPMFKAEMYEPEEWAKLFARSGAKYVVPTSKHHDGYCLWPSEEASKNWGRPWNSLEVGPMRDVLGDLAVAVREEGLQFGLYYSLYEWYHPWYRKRTFEKFRDEHYFPQFKDVVNRYAPALIFVDGEWDRPSEDWRSPELLAWLFNESPCKDYVVINDRWGKESRSLHGGYYTSEYGHLGRGKELVESHPWEENRGIGASFGYNRNESIDEYRSTAELIELLVDTVSRGGNLLLDVGPTADGRIPVIMQDRLVGIGAWLDINGEAIYGTRKWRVVKEGEHIYYTQKDGKVYAIITQWPGDTLKLATPKAEGAIKATLLGSDAIVSSTASEEGIVLDLSSVPFADIQQQSAWVLRLENVK